MRQINSVNQVSICAFVCVSFGEKSCRGGKKQQAVIDNKKTAAKPPSSVEGFFSFFNFLFYIHTFSTRWRITDAAALPHILDFKASTFSPQVKLTISNNFIHSSCLWSSPLPLVTHVIKKERSFICFFLLPPLLSQNGASLFSSCICFSSFNGPPCVCWPDAEKKPPSPSTPMFFSVSGCLVCCVCVQCETLRNFRRLLIFFGLSLSLQLLLQLFSIHLSGHVKIRKKKWNKPSLVGRVSLLPLAFSVKFQWPVRKKEKKIYPHTHTHRHQSPYISYVDSFSAGVC